ncbi:MAG: hypothetical protein SFV21_05310 [Rhodospirillaceae bacterium]|nr:hypothetical protein [Rhodospirillaceae bacterium]
MERRITAIEQSLELLRADTSGLMESSGKIQLDVAEIKGKLSQMPTGFQFIGWMAAFGISLIALVFAALKFSQP